MNFFEPKVILLQSGYAHYRDTLFNILADRHNLEIIYEQSDNTYPGMGEPKGYPHIFLDKISSFNWLGLIKILINKKPSIIIEPGSNSLRAVIAFIYARLFKKKLLLWIESWKTPTYPKNSIKFYPGAIRNFISKQIICRADAIIAGSAVSYQYLKSITDEKNKIFTALQCSNDLQKRELPIAKPNRLNKYTFLYLSRIIPLKGLDILIKAFGLLRKKRNDVSLLVAGDGQFKPFCYKLSKSLKIPDIHFKGSVDPGMAHFIFSQADIFILPSRIIGNAYDAWGLVLNEAMSMSLPVITTDAAGASFDLVVDGYNGYLIKENSIDDLYKAMNLILDQDLSQMGENSRKTFDMKNDFKRMANGFSSAIYHVKNDSKL